MTNWYLLDYAFILNDESLARNRTPPCIGTGVIPCIIDKVQFK
jgi:hypothetical protein